MNQPTHVFEFVIPESFTDIFGHANHARYLDIFEAARWDLVSGGGYTREVVQETQLGPIVLEMNVRYQRELVAGQKVTVISYLNPASSIRRVSKLKQEIRNDANLVCSQAVVSYGLFDMKNRKLVVPTERWKNAVGTPD